MNYIFYIFMVLIPIGILAFFTSLFIRKNRKLPRERNDSPLLEKTTGGRIGLINYNGPFIRFSIYREFIVISSFKQYLLMPHDIEEIYIKRRFLLRGIAVQTKKSGVPRLFFLYIQPPEKILTLLKENGFPVREETP